MFRLNVQKRNAFESSKILGGKEIKENWVANLSKSNHRLGHWRGSVIDILIGQAANDCRKDLKVGGLQSCGLILD